MGRNSSFTLNPWETISPPPDHGAFQDCGRATSGACALYVGLKRGALIRRLRSFLRPLTRRRFNSSASTEAEWNLAVRPSGDPILTTLCREHATAEDNELRLLCDLCLSAITLSPLLYLTLICHLAFLM